MISGFDDFLDILGGKDDFEIVPVDMKTFIHSPDYLGFPPLSEIQYQMVEAMTQIYKEHTLIELYGEKEGRAKFKRTYNEVIFQLGKGSGKDEMSSVACAYLVYLLLCLREPAEYYGKPAGDPIDILNIAINAQQAKNVFFKKFKTRVERCPWFQGRYTPTADAIKFDKEITVHSGHSERESWEGYNVIMVILDEIAGFAIESTTGHAQAKTAEEVYKMYKASVSSRYPDFGKLALLSFPRFKGDFITTRYDEVIAQKETVIKKSEIVINPELPHDLDGNSMEVEWEEDHIIAYKEPRVFAVKRPTWDVNPVRKITDFTSDFARDSVDALSRFACMPPDAIDGFFKSREKIERAFRDHDLAVDATGQFADWFKPDKKKKYYIHVDLAQKVDRCAVAMAHVEEWVLVKIGDSYQKYQPKVVVDAIRYWTPSSTETVDFAEVREYILDLSRMGFNIELVTFDRWNSLEMINQLKSYSLKSETLSVAKQHYTDMAMIVAEERLEGPYNAILIKELLQLRIIRDKVDHPRSGSKDLADATCGAIYNAVAYTPKEIGHKIDVHTYDPQKDDRKDRQAPEKKKPKSTQPIPKDLQDYLDSMAVL